MKKQDLTTLAMIGISAGLLVSGCQKGDHKNNRQKEASNFEQTNPDMQSFYSSLSSETQQKFMQLDAHGKMMAMEMAKQSCKGQNACKGMGGCETAKNTCAGKNSCKGQGGEPVKDADEAVHATYQNQVQKKNRNGRNNNRSNSYSNDNGNGRNNNRSNGYQNGNGNDNGNGNGGNMKKNNLGSNSCSGPGGCGGS